MKTRYRTTFFCLTLAFSAICSAGSSSSSLSFKDAWISEAPPVSKVLAAYMKILNHSDKAIVINTIESEDFSRIEFHRTIHENDIAKMRQQKILTVPESGSLTLEPGSYHLMLFNPVKRMTAGDSSIFTVNTADDQKFETKVTVKKSNSNHHQHQHHNH